MKLESIGYPEKYVCELTVSATAQELETAIEATYERKRETLHIKGYEIGKVSRQEAEAVRGQDFFWYDATNALLDAEIVDIYNAAIAEHQLDVVSECEYDLARIAKDEGFTVTVTTCLLPEFTFGDCKSIVVTQASKKVTEAEIDQIVNAQKEVKPELLDEFRARVRQKLEEHKNGTVETQAKNEVVMRFASLAQGELPSPMVNETYEAILTQLNDVLQKKNTTMEQFLQQTGHTKEEFRAQTKRGAENRVRTTLSLIRFGTQLGFVPTAQQIEEEILVRAEQVKGKLDNFAEVANRRKVRQSMIRKQAVAHILSQATIINPDEG